jgi:hypothetical protein
MSEYCQGKIFRLSKGGWAYGTLSMTLGPDEVLKMFPKAEQDIEEYMLVMQDIHMEMYRPPGNMEPFTIVVEGRHKTEAVRICGECECLAGDPLLKLERE